MKRKGEEGWGTSACDSLEHSGKRKEDPPATLFPFFGGDFYTKYGQYDPVRSRLSIKGGGNHDSRAFGHARVIVCDRWVTAVARDRN